MTTFLFMISVALWTLPGGELTAAHALTRDALYHVRYVQDLEYGDVSSRLHPLHVLFHLFILKKHSQNTGLV